MSNNPVPDFLRLIRLYAFAWMPLGIVFSALFLILNAFFLGSADIPGKAFDQEMSNQWTSMISWLLPNLLCGIGLIFGAVKVSDFPRMGAKILGYSLGASVAITILGALISPKSPEYEFGVTPPVFLWLLLLAFILLALAWFVWEVYCCFWIFSSLDKIPERSIQENDIS